MAGACPVCGWWKLMLWLWAYWPSKYCIKNWGPLWKQQPWKLRWWTSRPKARSTREHRPWKYSPVKDSRLIDALDLQSLDCPPLHARFPEIKTQRVKSLNVMSISTQFPALDTNLPFTKPPHLLLTSTAPALDISLLGIKPQNAKPPDLSVFSTTSSALYVSLPPRPSVVDIHPPSNTSQAANPPNNPTISSTFPTLDTSLQLISSTLDSPKTSVPGAGRSTMPQPDTSLATAKPSALPRTCSMPIAKAPDVVRVDKDKLRVSLKAGAEPLHVRHLARKALDSHPLDSLRWDVR